MNCQHPNISFTVETENDGCLPFLDVLVGRNDGSLLVSRKDGSLETSVYRKSTLSGLFQTSTEDFVILLFVKSK